jgi:hypothetical protein
MTNEILPRIVESPSPVSANVTDSAGQLPRLKAFLQDMFHVAPGAEQETYPGLPMLMSLLDTALDRRQPLHPVWDFNAVYEMRLAIELGFSMRWSKRSSKRRQTITGNYCKRSSPRQRSRLL